MRGTIERRWDRDSQYARMVWDQGWPHPDKPWEFECWEDDPDSTDDWGRVCHIGQARTHASAVYALGEHQKARHSK